MKHRITLVIVVLAMLVMSMAMIPVQAQEDVTITMWTHDQLYIDYFLEKAAEWEEQWPDYNITYDFQQIPDAPGAALTAIAAGEPLPDLLGLEISWFPRFMNNGIIDQYFVDLTDLISDRREQFVEGRWSPYAYEGKLYGVESALTAGVYYYQPAIFEEYGVEVPTTWEEFLQTGGELGEQGVALSVMTNDSQGPFHMYFLQRGGVIFDESGEFVFGEEANREIAIEVADFIQQGVQNGTFFLSLGDDFWGASIPTAFSEGRLAGIVMPDWYAGCCLKPGVPDMAGEWRVGPMPVWEAGGYSTSVWGGTAFAISKDTENLELVWSLLDYAYMTLDGQLDRYDAIQFYPTMYEALDHPRITDVEDPFFGNQKIGQVFADVALDTPVYYQSPNRQYFLNALGDNLPLLFDGTLSPEEFVDEIIFITQDEIDFNS